MRVWEWDGATWTDVVGFTAVIAAGVGDIMPTGLQVEQDYLVAVMWQTNTGGADGAVTCAIEQIGSGAETYVAMMRVNAERIAEALIP